MCESAFCRDFAMSTNITNTDPIGQRGREAGIGIVLAVLQTNARAEQIPDAYSEVDCRIAVAVLVALGSVVVWPFHIAFTSVHVCC